MYGLLSGLAAARVAERRPAPTIEELGDLTRRMRDTSDPREHDRLNYAFHQTINRAGGSRRLISVLRILSNNMPSHFYEHNTEWAFREQAFAEHDQIVGAIRAGDSDAALRAVATHFAHTGEQAVRMLRSVEFWPSDE